MPMPIQNLFCNANDDALTEFLHYPSLVYLTKNKFFMKFMGADLREDAEFKSI